MAEQNKYTVIYINVDGLGKLEALAAFTTDEKARAYFYDHLLPNERIESVSLCYRTMLQLMRDCPNLTNNIDPEPMYRV